VSGHPPPRLSRVLNNLPPPSTLPKSNLMAWSCPECGVQGLDDSTSSHPVEAGGCGYSKTPEGVALQSTTSGKEVRARLTTTFGKSSLKGLDDPEVRYVSAEQFKLEKRSDGWTVTSIPWATNPLYVNGSQIPQEGVLLKQGDQLSIKGKFLLLNVMLLS
jgi:hypothetical protein